MIWLQIATTQPQIFQMDRYNNTISAHRKKKQQKQHRQHWQQQQQQKTEREKETFLSPPEKWKGVIKLVEQSETRSIECENR